MRSLLLGIAISAAIAGCGDDGDDVVRPVLVEDWSYPADTSKVSLTVVAPDTAYVGKSFDVIIVVYNVPHVFGAAADVEYERDRVKVTSAILGPLLGPVDKTLGIAFVDSARGVVQVASTLRAGAPIPERATGVLCKLRCTPLRAGRARFRVDGDAEFKTATGGDVATDVRREEDRIEVIR